MNGEIKNKINIYCNDIVYESIIGISKYTLPGKLSDAILKVISFHILNTNDTKKINGINYTFFDIKAKGTKQFGFECVLNNKRLIFLGDEPLNKELYERVKNADYVMHEAFCLDSEESIFHPYQKNHSTVKSSCEVMEKLDVRNLILYHTEESHENNRKQLYTNEGKENFSGNVIVPDDLEIIDIL